MIYDDMDNFLYEKTTLIIKNEDFIFFLENIDEITDQLLAEWLIEVGLLEGGG